MDAAGMLGWHDEQEKKGKEKQKEAEVKMKLVGQQHVYLKTWDNEGVVSMLLGMELFLLVKHTHTHTPLKMELNAPTQKHA